MCICDEIEKERVLDSVIVSEMQPPAMITLTLCRTDRWSAELRMTGHIGEKYQVERFPLACREAIVWQQSETFIKRPINFCPICGRRLSLADASRREDA